jgi:hypothetical protein
MPCLAQSSAVNKDIEGFIAVEGRRATEGRWADGQCSIRCMYLVKEALSNI